jgi:hypothetical protein
MFGRPSFVILVILRADINLFYGAWASKMRILVGRIAQVVKGYSASGPATANGGALHGVITSVRRQPLLAGPDAAIEQPTTATRV